MTIVDPLAAGPLAAAWGVTRLTEAARNYLDSLIAAVPTLATALVVLVLFWFGAGAARNAANSLSERVTDDENLKRLFGTLARITVIVIGLFVTASILFPGLEAGDLVAVLGLSSVAIGFAFKDIFENFLAGILILIQRPFHIDDQILVDDHEGIVENINIRSTFLKTFDGERVIIPNSDIYSSAVRVRTAFDERRTAFQTGIGYDENVDEGREVILEALESCEQILDEPAPQVLVTSHGDSAVGFDVRYWTDSRKGNVVAARDEVATEVKAALDEADIEIPYPYRTVEFFDKTDDEGADPTAA
jgi:small-conductance mechanosensitive channel